MIPRLGASIPEVVRVWLCTVGRESEKAGSVENRTAAYDERVVRRLSRAGELCPNRALAERFPNWSRGQSTRRERLPHRRIRSVGAPTRIEQSLSSAVPAGITRPVMTVTNSCSWFLSREDTQLPSRSTGSAFPHIRLGNLSVQRVSPVREKKRPHRARATAVSGVPRNIPSPSTATSTAATPNIRIASSKRGIVAPFSWIAGVDHRLAALDPAGSHIHNRSRSRPHASPSSVPALSKSDSRCSKRKEAAVRTGSSNAQVV
jgi:hypothetical protein